MTPHYARVGKTLPSKYVNDESGVKNDMYFIMSELRQKKALSVVFCSQGELKKKFRRKRNVV